MDEAMMKSMIHSTVEAMNTSTNIYMLAAAAAAAAGGGGGIIIIIIIIILISYASIWRVVQHLWLRPRTLQRCLAAQGLNGNPYRLWFGDMKELDRITKEVQSKPIGVDEDIVPYVLPFLHRTLALYGKRTLIWNGPNAHIIIMDPNMIKDVLQRYQVFRKLDANPLNELLITGLITYEGDKWLKHRRLLNSSFTLAKLKDMVPTMHISCNELMAKLEEAMPPNTSSSSHEVDVWPILSYFTADIISRTAFGSNYKQGQKIFLLQREQVQLFTRLKRLVYIPGSRFLPTKINRRMKKISEEIVDVIRGIIQKKVEGMETANKINNNNDLLGILLESNRKEVQENGDNKEMGITIDDVVDECKLFYIAGQETTSNLLVWTMVMLSIHQNWQMEAREEVSEIFGKNIPDFDGLQQLKKMNMILHEVLRLYPPLPTVHRKLEKNMKVGDISLPSGVKILLPTLLVHHDKDIWGEDAKEFKPERFAQGVSKAAKGQLAAFFPFSVGPRICIGMNFAMVEAKIALVMILQRFSFQLSPNYEHAPVSLLTLQPKFGAKILLSRRS